MGEGFGLDSLDKTSWIIKDLIEETEAYSKGLRRDDRIVSVNGNVLTKKTSDKIYNILQNENKIDNEKKSVAVCVERKSRITRHLAINTEGFGLGSFDKTLWTIKDLKEETEAYLKGFRCGDKIVSVDDELLTKKTCDKIAEILQ